MKNTEEYNSQLKKSLIEKISLDTCTEQDFMQIDKLCKIDTTFSDNVAEVRRSKQLYDDIEFLDTLNLEKEYKEVEIKIRRKRKLYISNKLQRVAAVLAIPLLISTFILCYVQFLSSEDNTRLVEVVVPYGAILNYELPDRSKVCLNSGSKLTYPTKFNDKRREVTLDGEGYFTVSADKEHPFYVHTAFKTSCYVYGTQFNVNAYKEDNLFETILVEGHLNVFDINTSKYTVLMPGQALTYDPIQKTNCLRSVDLEEKMGWTSGQLIFRDTPLTELIKRLERRYNVDIIVDGTIDEAITIHGKFLNETLEEVLDYLVLSLNISWAYLKNSSDTSLERRKQIKLALN